MSTVLGKPPAGGFARNWRERFRPELSQESLISLFSVVIVACLNSQFWEAAADHRSPTTVEGLVFLGSTGLCIVALHAFLLGMISTRRTIRLTLGVTWLIAVLVAYYMRRYTVYLDAHMMRNVLHTESKEAAELITRSMLLTVFAACVPVWCLLAWVRVTSRRIVEAVVYRLIWLTVCAVVALLAVLSAYGDLSPLLRNHREVRYLVTPANALVATLAVVGDELREGRKPKTPIGEDAVVNRTQGARARLLVVVVGETVRAQNWGLNGYERDTTPGLGVRNVVNFPDVSACGSNTEVSLPCLFAPIGRRDYDESRIRSQQSLLHVLDRVGIETLWLDNQTGCKGVCEELPIVRIRGDEDPSRCDGKVCLDAVLFDRAASELRSAGPGQADRVIIVHPLGNHGPAYSRRYPKAFRAFVPTCESPDLDGCDDASIRNSYDNAILYSDHLLSGLIDELAQREDLDTALIYVSDHGESLGEHGIYLHGLPYVMAPDVQLKVPMFVWMNHNWSESGAIDMKCLRETSGSPQTHDFLFHSVLGLFGVRSKIYEPNLDLFAPCRS